MSGNSPDSSNAKRASPSLPNPPMLKKLKGADGSSQSSGAAGGAPNNVDPEALSDALLSAGVDLKEEENIMSLSLSSKSAPAGYQTSHHGSQYLGSGISGPTSGLSLTGMGSGGLQGLSGHSDITATAAGTAAPANLPPPYTPFLELARLQVILQTAAVELGLETNGSSSGGGDPNVLKLISFACEEWIKDILGTAIMLSRHRRRSRNTVHSDTARALRGIAQKDKDAEFQRIAKKLANQGPETSKELAEDKKAAMSEDNQYKAANATALMMTSGKRKYSWMTGGTPGGNGGGGVRAIPGSQRTDGGVRFREAREEQGFVLRDLLGAMEEQRVGVEKALQKGYSKLRN